MAEVKVALDALANVGKAAGYLTIRSVDRDFVAAHVLEERPASPGYLNVGAIQTEIGADATVVGSALEAHSNALVAINGLEYTSTPVAVVAALDTLLDEDFAKLSAVEKSAVAQAFHDKLVFTENGTDLKTNFITQ